MAVAADSRTVTDAVLALLQGAGLTVYDAEAAEGATPPYVVVYPATDVLDGTMGEPYADADRTLQVNAIGRSRQQAQWTADKVAQTLLGTPHRNVTVSGRALRGAIRHVGGRWLGRDEDTAGPALFGKSDDYLIPTTPL